MSNRRVVFVILCVGLVTFANAQEQKFKAGVKAGLNTSQIIGDGYAGFNKLNPQLGFILQNKLKKKINFN